MSLNGDTMVMRNGRSTSQVSIYNYPEHLNPFYEDDQHKRLRFWQINKKGRNGEEGRRNSFSMSGLKDMWAFKSFRLGKKRSSTLGINKTSESPPPLRRDYDYANGGNGACNTYDPRMRYSTNTTTNDAFQRNAGYRSSLQNMHATNDSNGLSFNRNNQYRSTIQFAGNRYGGGNANGSQSNNITPQPPRRYAQSLTPQPVRNDYERGRDGALLRGSSQCSVSTNPFETDNEYDDDDDNNNEREITPYPGERTEHDSSNGSAAKKRTPRKKRRAPPVPVPVHKTNLNESSQGQSATDAEPLRIVENTEISNLTAEIESFVNASNNDDTEPIVNEHSTTATATATDTRLSSHEANAKDVTKTTTTTTVTTTRTAEQDERPHVERQSALVNASAAAATKKANGAIPKEHNKTNNNNKNNVTTTTTTTTTTKTQEIVSEKEMPALKIEEPVELRIAEEERTQAPTPQQRTKAVVELEKETANGGHLECIHVHIDEDRCETPVERESPSRVTSFKPMASPRTHETPKITTKTAFTLVNPPTSTTSTSTSSSSSSATTTTTTTTSTTQHELHISEPHAVERRSKPALAAKPANIPQINITAEVHKPNRRIANEDTSPTTITVVTPSEMAVATEVPPQVNKMTSEHKVVRIAEPEVTKTMTDEPPNYDMAVTDVDAAAAAAAPPVELLTTKRTTTASVLTTAPTTTSAPALRIVESQENLQESTRDERFYVPKPRSLLDWKQSTLAPLETNVPPEKRKSVKDIIESINRSQRLLQAAAHKDTPLSDSEMREARIHGTMTPVMPRKFSEPNNNFDDHRQPPVKSPRKINSNPSIAGAGALLDSDEDDEMDDDEDGTQKLNNADIFKKCRVNKEVYDYRETSPTASNLDWNPLPKPKRTKNMPDI